MTHLRGKALESENVANKMRIESLETWILKLNDKTEEVQGKITNVDPDKETEHLEQRIDALGRELNFLWMSQLKKERKKERLTMYVLVYLMFCAPSLTYNV